MNTLKSKSLLIFLACMMSLFFISCGDDTANDTTEVTGIVMSQDTLSVEVGSVATLVATLQPEGSTGDILWTSSATSIATVTNGIVTGISEGTTTVVASYGIYSATCNITVVPEMIDLSDYESLQGSNYYPIVLDATTYETISDRVVQDLRVDDETKFLYIWDNTLTGTIGSGLNYFGQAEAWVGLSVGSVGWSGAGFNIDASFGSVDMTDMYTNPDDYYFHIALKSSQASSSYLFKFKDGTSEVAVCIGSYDFVDGATFPVYTDFTHDGEWQSIEIPVTYLNEQGLFFNTPLSNDNIVEFLAGGISGTTIDIDAMFFYKK